MGRLIDLMTMGFKYQFLTCSCAEDLLDVTLNHIEAVKRISTSNAELLSLVKQCEELLHIHYKDMSMYDFRELRQQLALFFQDRKVKVSLFLQDETQNYDGSIKVKVGGSLPYNTTPPGTITYFHQDGPIVPQPILGVPMVSAERYVPSANRIRRVNVGEDRWTNLGTNLYVKDRGNANALTTSSSKKGKNEANGNSKSTTGAGTRSPVPDSPTTKDIKEAKKVVGELNALASLIGVGSTSGRSDKQDSDNNDQI